MHVKNFQRSIVKQTKVDLILSSGLLAFARHAGVIAALEDFQSVEVERVVGTSSGALAGSLLAAGLSASQISSELSRQRPIRFLSPVFDPRNGLFSLRKLTRY